jgi:hypothetical protein
MKESTGVHELLLEAERAVGFEVGGEADAPLQGAAPAAASGGGGDGAFPLLGTHEKALRQRYVKVAQGGAMCAQGRPSWWGCQWERVDVFNRWRGWGEQTEIGESIIIS